MRMSTRQKAALIWTVDKLRHDRYGNLPRLRFFCDPLAAHDVCVSVRQALPFACNYSDAQILWTFLRHLLRR